MRSAKSAALFFLSVHHSPFVGIDYNSYGCRSYFYTYGKSYLKYMIYVFFSLVNSFSVFTSTFIIRKLFRYVFILLDFFLPYAILILIYLHESRSIYGEKKNHYQQFFYCKTN